MCFYYVLGRAGLELPRARKEPTDMSHSHSPHAGSPRHGEYLSGFKDPVAFPIFIDLVPPAETHHEPPSYVLRKRDKMMISAPWAKGRSSPVCWRIKQKVNLYWEQRGGELDWGGFSVFKASNF